MKNRTANIVRKTNETEIELQLVIDGNGKSKIATGIGFFDHMLEIFSKHSLFDLTINMKGDLRSDDHHMIEDAGIALGEALRLALGEKKGIIRFGSAILPMDEVLCLAAVDLSGRFSFASDYVPVREKVGDLSTEMVNHFFLSFAVNAGMNLHFQFLNHGENEHHRIEAMFKAFARALRIASERDSRIAGMIPSTKGVL